MDTITALEDTRIVDNVTMRGDHGRSYSAKPGIEIRAYDEPGNILWFVIIEDGEVIKRLNGAAVESITYA
jgi:hypothetical protein